MAKVVSGIACARVGTRAKAVFRCLAPAAAAAALLASWPAAAEMERRSLAVGEAAREYLLFLPDQSPVSTGARPLVIVLHGGGTPAPLMALYSRFNEIAARESFAVAYPQGAGMWWNDGRMTDGSAESRADDVSFIRALVADIGATATIDRRRVFATGISNGGFMSLRLACEASDLVAAVAPVAATMPRELGTWCRPAKPVSLLVINGTADRMVPYVGGFARTPFSLRGAIWSTDRTVEFWARHNRCADRPSLRVLPKQEPSDEDSHVIQADYRGCAGAPVRLLRVEGGGHTWPGSVDYAPFNMFGATNYDIDATEAIWSFFKSAPAR